MNAREIERFDMGFFYPLIYPYFYPYKTLPLFTHDYRSKRKALYLWELSSILYLHLLHKTIQNIIQVRSSAPQQMTFEWS